MMSKASEWVGLWLAVLLQPTFSSLLSVTFDGSNYYTHDKLVKNWVATGSFYDNTTNDGWGYLEIETNPSFPDTVQAYAAGFAEGILSKDMIYNSYRNTLEGLCERTSEEFCENLRAYIKTNFQWMQGMITEKSNTCPLWHNVELILAQLQGVTDGYNKSAEEPMMEGAILLMNMGGDLLDLEDALDPNILNMSMDEWAKSGRTTGDGHCSVLIKLLPGNIDLYVSHNTWLPYQFMLRILKKYILPFRRTGTSEPQDTVPGHTASFPSYPGLLYSGDDYHILSSGLVTLETTIKNGNPALWKNVTAKGQLQEWIRTIVANRVAVDGKSWTDFFSMHNSGTFNNQWMVVDYKLFKPKEDIRPNTLWVLEQLPGMIVADDQSHILRKQSYWPSYNVPFYKSIFNLSGAPAMVKRYGDWFSYDKTPRALIFKRDHASVKNMPTMIKLMRYNDFKHDELSRCNCTPPYSAENAISARNDLNPKNGTYPFGPLRHRPTGGIDMKVTNFEMAYDFLLAVNGPTYDQQPVFKWSEQDFAKDTPHYGHPDAWKFQLLMSNGCGDQILIEIHATSWL